ncbi:MAG: ATP-binding cassette domain-containing protein, partial [Rhizobiales bacterium]|nr:ATP-binding cassette domain-containing protein [Hyphomicrobiales bacterium]
MSADHAATDWIVEATGLTKRFFGFAAVSGVDLKVRRHSIHALIGPNGAGKTTTFNLITKFLAPSEGRILYNGEDITRESPAKVAQRGIVRSFQISAIFPRMSVGENVRIALQRKLGTAFHFWRPERSLSALDARVDELLEAVGLAGQRDQLAAGKLGAWAVAPLGEVGEQRQYVVHRHAALGHHRRQHQVLLHRQAGED